MEQKSSSHVADHAGDSPQNNPEKIHGWTASDFPDSIFPSRNRFLV